MKHAGDEDYLTEAAAAGLDGEEVLAAGIFGWQDLLLGQVVGSTVGAVGTGTVTGSGLAAGAAAGLGGRLVKQEMAAEAGMTLELLVAVTPSAIRVLNFDGDKAEDQVVAFERETTDVHVSKLGLSRIVRLHDRSSDAKIELHATAAPFLAQSKADKVVLHLLATPS